MSDKNPAIFCTSGRPIRLVANDVLLFRHISRCTWMKVGTVYSSFCSFSPPFHSHPFSFHLSCLFDVLKSISIGCVLFCVFGVFSNLLCLPTFISDASTFGFLANFLLNFQILSLNRSFFCCPLSSVLRLNQLLSQTCRFGCCYCCPVNVIVFRLCRHANLTHGVLTFAFSTFGIFLHILTHILSYIRACFYL